jgi:hypothetical protein
MQEIAETRGRVGIPLERGGMDRQVKEQMTENGAGERNSDTGAPTPPQHGGQRCLRGDRRDRMRPAIEPLSRPDEFDPADGKAEPEQVRQEYQAQQRRHGRTGLCHLDGQAGCEMTGVHQRRLSL